MIRHVMNCTCVTGEVANLMDNTSITLRVRLTPGLVAGFEASNYGLPGMLDCSDLITRVVPHVEHARPRPRLPTCRISNVSDQWSIRFTTCGVIISLYE